MRKPDYKIWPFLAAWVAMFVVTTAALSPPLLFTAGARWTKVGCLVHLSFSGLCHQMPERSLHFSGFTPAVCARCLSLYVGILAGLSVVLVVIRLHRRTGGRRTGVAFPCSRVDREHDGRGVVPLRRYRSRRNLCRFLRICPPGIFAILFLLASIEPLLGLASVVDTPVILRMAGGFILGTVPFLAFLFWHDMTRSPVPVDGKEIFS